MTSRARAGVWSVILVSVTTQMLGCAADAAPQPDLGAISGLPADFEPREIGEKRQALSGGVWGETFVRADGTHFDAYSSRAPQPFSTNSALTWKIGTGRYAIVFDGLGGDGGHAQVAARSMLSSNRCAIFGFAPLQQGHEYVEVACTLFNGVLADTDFWVQFMRGPGGTGLAGYAGLATQLATGVRHTVPANLSYNSRAGTNTILKETTGRFQVKMPSIHGARAPMIQVSSVGQAGEYCKIIEDQLLGTRDLLVRVSCFNFLGQPADAMFLINAFTDFEAGINGGGAYGRANQPNNQSWYTPTSGFNSGLNTCGSLNARARLGIPNPDWSADPEAYIIEFPSMFDDDEPVVPHVTAQGSDNSYCVIMQDLGVGTSGRVTTEHLAVHCFFPNGTRARSSFYATLSSHKPPCGR